MSLYPFGNESILQKFVVPSKHTKTIQIYSRSMIPPFLRIENPVFVCVGGPGIQIKTPFVTKRSLRRTAISKSLIFNLSVPTFLRTKKESTFPKHCIILPSHSTPPLPSPNTRGSLACKTDGCYKFTFRKGSASLIGAVRVKRHFFLPFVENIKNSRKYW